MPDPKDQQPQDGSAPDETPRGEASEQDAPEQEQPAGEAPTPAEPEETAQPAAEAGPEPSDAGVAFDPGDNPDEQVSNDELGSLTEALLEQVHAAVNDANAGTGAASGEAGAPEAPVPPPEGSRPVDLPSFDSVPGRRMPAELDLLADVNLNVKIELGRTRLLVDDVLRLGEGAVVELDKLAGDPVDIYVNERHIAKGEVLVLNDNFCVRINEIVEPEAKRTG
jgi:flagellar motor switch protein FliN